MISFFIVSSRQSQILDLNTTNSRCEMSDVDFLYALNLFLLCWRVLEI